MEKRITFVGMDAHKVAIKLAVLLPGQTKPVEWQLANEKAAVRRMLKQVQRLALDSQVRFCYEAGPCGYALQRWIQEAGLVCVVVAPSLIPRKPGDRIKTDRRDARKLAELFRAGLLTEVHAPTPTDEAARDLCRAREDAQEDLMRCRHRLSKMLLRRGWTWNGTKRAWSQAHRLWLRSLRLEHEADQLVLEDYLLAIEQLEQRLPWLEQRIEQLSQQPAYAEAVAALRCFRGIDTITPMGLVSCMALPFEWTRIIHRKIVEVVPPTCSNRRHLCPCDQRLGLGPGCASLPASQFSRDPSFHLMARVLMT